MNKGKILPFEGIWNRADVAKDTNNYYVFGDNTADRINGYVPNMTQAVIRGLPNAIGIDTKHNRGLNESSYFTNDMLKDIDYLSHLNTQKNMIDKLLTEGHNVYIPMQNGKLAIGAGKAQLPTRAPEVYEYLSNMLVPKDLGSAQFNSTDDILEDIKKFSISFTGHRPKDLPSEFGYDYNSPAWRATIDKTKDGIKYYKPTQVITGMALGYDQAALIAANELRKEGLWNGKIIGDLPFPESGKGQMSNEQWQGYLDMLDEINYLANGYNGNKQIYQDRNELMVDNSDLVMALYNGANHGGTYNDLVYAKKKGVPAVNIYNNVMKLLNKK